MEKNMQNNNVAVRISGVKKVYKLGQIGGGTLQADLQSWWARRRGREDPNMKIGQTERLVGQTFMALNGIDLTIYKGDAIGIIGGNGAGKSTLLKLLSRVTAPTDGEIELFGRVASMLEVGTGFNGEMTGRENIYMNGAILGMTRSEIDAKMEDIIEFSEVREFIDTPVKRYSSGMYVKLAFSVAAHLDSEIMIMDEVLAVGDMAFQKKCLTKMREAASVEGRTVLYVSHNMNTIRQLCDKCVVLDKGKIIFEGNVDDAINVYLGTAEKLEKHYEYTKEYTRLKLSSDKFVIQTLDILESDDVRYTYGSHAHVRLVCTANQVWNNVAFQFEIVSSDGMNIGTMFTKERYNFAANVPSELDLDLDLDHLAPGRYKANIVAFLSNAQGGQQPLDGVYPGFHFEISDEMTDQNDLVWDSRFLGYMRLNAIQNIVGQNE